jgi:hypothetical protein
MPTTYTQIRIRIYILFLRAACLRRFILSTIQKLWLALSIYFFYIQYLRSDLITAKLIVFIWVMVVYFLSFWILKTFSFAYEQAGHLKNTLNVFLRLLGFTWRPDPKFQQRTDLYVSNTSKSSINYSSCEHLKFKCKLNSYSYFWIQRHPSLPPTSSEL